MDDNFESAFNSNPVSLFHCSLNMKNRSIDNATSDFVQQYNSLFNMSLRAFIIQTEAPFTSQPHICK